MDQVTVIIVVAIVLAIVFVVTLFRRSGRGSVSFPGVDVSIESDKPGASVRGNVVDGTGNKMTASGPGASIERNEVRGGDNEFTAN
jgi:hypothetical protein